MGKSASKSLFKGKSKEQFVSIINSIKEQRDFDLGYSKRLNALYGWDNDVSIPPYNNSRLENALVKLLQDKYQSVKEKGFCEIEYFINDLDFGRDIPKGAVLDKGIVSTPEELWELLMVKFLVEDASQMIITREQ